VITDFFDRSKLPGRKPLVTRRDAVEYVMGLPEGVHGLLAACVRRGIKAKAL
jgi:hypothetical protein